MNFIKINSRIKVNEKEDNKIEVFNGSEYLVLPVVMIVEGVLNGGLYPLDEIKKSVDAWNGRPATMDHPRLASGVPITANTPETLEAVQLGIVFGAKISGNSLVGEAWILADKYDEVKDITEVSTGLFVDHEEATGEYNGKSYDYIARNFNPDHLALLPDKTGSCSNEDGCGIQINESKENVLEKEEIEAHNENCGCEGLKINEDGSKKDQSAIIKWFKTNIEKVFGQGEIVTNASVNQKWDLARKAIVEKFKNDNSWIGIQDMDVDGGVNIVFWTENKSTYNTRFYKVSYSLNDNETKLILSDDIVEVNPLMTYPEITDLNILQTNNEDETNNDNSNNGGDSVEEKDTTEQSSAMSNNSSEEGVFMTHSEIEKVARKAGEDAVATYKANEAEAAETKKRGEIISGILANEDNPLSEDTLKKFSTNELEKTLERYEVNSNKDFTGQGQPVINSNEGSNTKRKATSVIKTIQANAEKRGR